MIPITFNKDDINNVKKGNVRGQDLASFLSISMPKRAGVLDIFDDPCGYVQITPTTGYATVTMKKGYVNIYGRCIYVEQGEQVQIALPTSGSVTGTFGIRVDLGETGANEVAWFTKTTTLQQDNILNNEITGIYEFALYNYTATNNSLELTKVAPIIQNIDDYLKSANFETKANATNNTSLATTQFVHNIVDVTDITSQVTVTQATYVSPSIPSPISANFKATKDYLGNKVIKGQINWGATTGTDAYGIKVNFGEVFDDTNYVVIATPKSNLVSGLYHITSCFVTNKTTSSCEIYIQNHSPIKRVTFEKDNSVNTGFEFLIMGK